ncbi:MAG: hydroxyacid dehydrogenase [Rhizobiales bacterium]|nr:hydroxyacid dehydrogenase [Hyphomicrobiales bacterium]
MILVDPYPRIEEMIFTGASRARLDAVAELHCYWGEGRMPSEDVERLLPRADIIIGQTHLDRARIDRAERLKAVINVKGNWEPFIDYDHLQARGVYVLTVAPCFGPAVAEWCLGAAIDLGRGITRADGLFRAGREAYSLFGNRQAVSLFGAEIGLIGHGNLGRALLPLLRPFGPTIRVYDPWLHDHWLAAEGVTPATLDQVLTGSDFLFLLAGVSTDNQGFLDTAALDLIRQDAAVILGSRAEIVDFDALIARAEAGAFRLAVDVHPEEPVPASAAIRKAEQPLLSSHRAGGIPDTYRRISEWLADDVEQILNGLPPLRLQRAEPALAAKMRSR